MKERRNGDLPAGVDEVSAAYRAARFQDTPPPHIDAQILAAAKRVGPRRANQYLPPLALAATVVLALGIVLRLALPGPGERESVGSAGLRSAPVADELGAPMLMQESAGTAAADSLTAPAAAARSVQPSEALPSADVAACTPAQRDGPEQWLACIALQLNGDALDRARTEYAEFTRTYPDYPVPAEIAARIGR